MPEVPVFDAYLDDRGVVFVSGEIDVMSVVALRRVLDRALDQTAGKLVVDLSEVRFIDAAGVGALVEAANRAAADDRSFLVTRPSAHVRRIAEILGSHWPLEVV